jgi:outer membrane protein assembly factor BamB
MHTTRNICWLVLAVSSSLSSLYFSQTVAEIRTWTDSTGKHSVEARFLALDLDKIKLQRRDGKVIEILLTRLSPADRKFARQAASSTASETAQAVAITAANFDWPQWRGPNRDGISEETGLLDRWPDKGPRELWRTRGLGKGYASVSIAGGKIFSLGRLGGQTHIVAMDVADGTVLWTVPVGGGGDPNCTPTVDGDLVFGLSHGGDLLCADVNTGEAVWHKNFPADFGGKMMSGWGYSESPLVDGNKLVCTPGARGAIIAALDKRTGKTIWKTPMTNAGSRGADGAAYSSIVVGQGGGVRQYVQLVGRGVIGVDADKGKLLWGYNRIANGTANISTPLIAGDFVFCSTGYGTGSALLRLGGRRGQISAEEVYFKTGKQLQNHHGGMILLKDHVYMGHGHDNGHPVCVNLRTGRDAWRPGRGPGTGSAAITCADGHLYFRYQNGVMALIEATPDSYKLKGSFNIAINNGRSWAHPVISNGRLYLRDQDEMICYDIRKPTRS